MRLTSITLRNFRGVSESTVDFGPGVTIVAGPNEVGKSSIAEAIRLVRTAKHSSRTAQIRALQPVGRDVGPEVELSLRSGGYDVWIRKQWLRNPATELRVSGDRIEQLSGDEAHERFLGLLGQTMDLDLFDALEVTQGRSLDEAELAGIRTLNQALDANSGPVADHDHLLERIDTEYFKFFTVGGKPTKDYRDVGVVLPELEAAVNDLRDQSRDMDRFTDDHARENEQLATYRAQLAEAKERLTHWRARDEELTELRDRVTRATSSSQAASIAKAEAITARDDRADLVAELGERAAARDQAEQMRAAAANDASTGAEKSRELLAARDSAREARDAARVAAAAATTAVENATTRAEHLAAQQRLADATAHANAELQATTALAELAVTPDLLTQITTAATELEVARSARDAAAAGLRIEVLGDDPVTIDGEPVTDTIVQPVTTATTIEVPGRVRVTVSPGTAVEARDQRVETATDALAELLRRARVDSLTAARDQAARRTDTEHEIQLAKQALASALAGETLEELRTRAATLALQAQRVRTADGEDDLEALKAAATATTGALSVADAALAAAETARADHERETAKAREELIRAESTLSERNDELARTQARLDQARARAADATLSAAVAAAEEAVASAEAEVLAARTKLAGAEPDSVAMNLSNATDLVETMTTNVADSQVRLAGLQTLLDDRATRGIYDKLSEAEAELEAASARYANLHRQAEASRLLREVLHRHRDAAHAAYVAPFAASIDRLGRHVFGPDFAVEISPELTVTGRTLDGDTVPFESLSAGAREQLGLIGRLAAAGLVDPDGGAPVILDDTLGFADDQRLDALGAVLNDVSSRAQIVILTCQPNRFAGVGGAHTVHLRSAPLVSPLRR